MQMCRNDGGGYHEENDNAVAGDSNSDTDSGEELANGGQNISKGEAFNKIKTKLKII